MERRNAVPTKQARIRPLRIILGAIGGVAAVALALTFICFWLLYKDSITESVAGTIAEACRNRLPNTESGAVESEGNALQDAARRAVTEFCDLAGWSFDRIEPGKVSRRVSYEPDPSQPGITYRMKESLHVEGIVRDLHYRIFGFQDTVNAPYSCSFSRDYDHGPIRLIGISVLDFGPNNVDRAEDHFRVWTYDPEASAD